MQHPLAAWIEATIGLRTEADGRLRRREPLTLADGSQRLAAQTGASFHQCRPAARGAVSGTVQSVRRSEVILWV
jgi:hypothetical protein